MAAKGPRETAVVVEKAHDLLLWLLPKVEKFPRGFGALESYVLSPRG